MTQKGNAFLGLGQFDAAKESYESLRTLGDNTAADNYLKKLCDAQARDANCIDASFSPSLQDIKFISKTKSQNASNTKCQENK